MVCQVFSAFWNTTTDRNNHLNHKQTRDLDWLTDPYHPVRAACELLCILQRSPEESTHSLTPKSIGTRRQAL
jgi:hypothetical protein